jgi:phosphoadenosine phosphosulfate reductase
MQTLPGTDLMTSTNERFASADPRDILRWAIEEAGFDRIAVASAFQAEGTVVMHMATEIRRDIPVLFLQTGFHFAETLAFKQQLTERLNLNVIDLVGDFTVESQREAFGDRLFERDPARCCDINKVQPMFRALRDLDAWVTAFRRRPLRPRARPADREDQSRRNVEPQAGLAVPEGERPAPQPPLRPRLRIDRLRPLHADAVPR